MKNLVKSLKTNGLVPRVHGNKHRLPKNTISHEDIKEIVVGIKIDTYYR